MILQLTGERATRYQRWLAYFSQIDGEEPNYERRTAAFFNSRDTNPPL